MIPFSPDRFRRRCRVRLLTSLSHSLIPLGRLGTSREPRRSTTSPTLELDQTLNSEVRLGPDKYELGPLPFPEVARPGRLAARESIWGTQLPVPSVQ